MDQRLNNTQDMEAASIWDPCFELICDMEEPLTASHELVRALLLMATGMDEQDGIPVNRVAMILWREIKAARELRDELFHTFHPHRAGGQA